MVARQTADDTEFKAVLSAKINDKDTSNWVELDDLRARYAD